MLSAFLRNGPAKLPGFLLLETRDFWANRRPVAGCVAGVGRRAREIDVNCGRIGSSVGAQPADEPITSDSAIEKVVAISTIKGVIAYEAP